MDAVIEWDDSVEGAARPPVLDFHGVEVDHGFLLRSCSAAERRALLHSLIEENWVDRDELLQELEEFFSHDPSWLCDVYDLLVDMRLWPWISTWDASLLSSLSGVVPPAVFHNPELVSFLWRVHAQLECRPEALYSGDAARFARFVEERVEQTLH